MSPRALAVIALLNLLWVGNCAAQVCVVSAVPPAFAAYRGSQNDGQGSITVTCTLAPGPNISYAIDLSSGLHAQGNQRRMAFAGSYLRYNLFCTASYAAPWFDPSDASSCQVSGSFPLVHSHTVYARIPGNQFVMPPGPYLDSVQITVRY